MTPARKTARRWTPAEIDEFASKPDFAKADEMARELGGLIFSMWFAPKDARTEEKDSGWPSAEVGQQS